MRNPTKSNDWRKALIYLRGVRDNSKRRDCAIGYVITADLFATASASASAPALLALAPSQAAPAPAALAQTQTHLKYATRRHHIYSGSTNRISLGGFKQFARFLSRFSLSIRVVPGSRP